jgi:hypothetical protein
MPKQRVICNIRRIKKRGSEFILKTARDKECRFKKSAASVFFNK